MAPPLDACNWSRYLEVVRKELRSKGRMVKPEIIEKLLLAVPIPSTMKMHGTFIIAGSFCDYLLGRLNSYSDIDIYWSGDNTVLWNHFQKESEYNHRFNIVTFRSGIVNGVMLMFLTRLSSKKLIDMSHAVTRGVMQYEPVFNYYILHEENIAGKRGVLNPPLTASEGSRYPEKHWQNLLIPGVIFPNSLFDLAYLSILDLLRQNNFSPETAKTGGNSNLPVHLLTSTTDILKPSPSFPPKNKND